LYFKEIYIIIKKKIKKEEEEGIEKVVLGPYPIFTKENDKITTPSQLPHNPHSQWCGAMYVGPIPL
jgi:uncharacterized membrane protein